MPARSVRQALEDPLRRCSGDFYQFWAHVFSGVIFFSQNAWDGWGAWGYSLTYHLSSKIPEGVLSLAILMVLPLSALKKAAKGAART